MKVPSPIVSADWLHQNLGHQDLVVLDASVPKPKSAPDNNPYHNLQLPESRFFDLNGNFSDPASDLPHMMPDEEHFIRSAQNLGINQDSNIVIYDNIGLYASPRAWWMFKSMGHKEVAVLDGGLPEWVKGGYPTEKKSTIEVARGDFIGRFNPEFFVNSADILRTSQQGDRVILDARSAGRFAGTEAEPRAGLRHGHIPTSKSLPFGEVQAEGKLKSAAEIMSVFQELNPARQPMAFSCGSGLTACILALAATVAGYDDLTIYDGSWSEWGASELPIETGA